MITKISIRATMAAMAIGQTITVPEEMCKYNTARNYASLLGMELQRRYGVHLLRDIRACEIKRYE